MSFLSPLALLFLVSVPVLILLYFLKLKRPRIEAPSTLLWQKVIEDMRVNSPFQKLKRSLLMFLQLLILLALIFCLARPLLRVTDTKESSLIVLIDNSASMQTVEDGSRTRLDIAKDAARELADNLSRGSEMMVIAFNRKASISSFSNNKRVLKEAIAGIEPTACSTDITPALLLAQSIANARARPRVILLSDGAFGPTAPMSLPVDIEYQKIGTKKANLAVTGLDIRRALHDRNRIEMFVAVQNFSDAAFTGTMRVQLDRKTLDTKYFSADPKQTRSQIFEADLPAGGNVSVEFVVADGLACDNRAWKVILPPVARKVLVVGEKTFFIERVCKASAGIQYDSILPGEYTTIDPRKYFAVIWDNVASPKIAPCNNIYIGCVPPGIEGLKAGEKIESPDILDWDNGHPANRFIDYNNLVIAATRELTVPEYAQVILRSSRTPLICVIERPKGSLCVIGFDSFQSNWPLLVSYPLFVNNCMDYFEERAARMKLMNIPVGGTLALPAGAKDPYVELPDGTRADMIRNAGGDYSFTGVDKCGIYRIHDGDKVQCVSANLFDRNESLLNVSDAPNIAGERVEASTISKQVNKEYWKYLLVVAFFVVLIEWLVYHKRLLV